PHSLTRFVRCRFPSVPGVRRSWYFPAPLRDVTCTRDRPWDRSARRSRPSWSPPSVSVRLRRRSALRDRRNASALDSFRPAGRSVFQFTGEFDMKTLPWIRQLFTRNVTRTIRKAPRRDRPVLELLEVRCVPSTFTVNSTADNGSGSGLVGD